MEQFIRLLHVICSILQQIWTDSCSNPSVVFELVLPWANYSLGKPFQFVSYLFSNGHILRPGVILHAFHACDKVPNGIRG